MKSDIEIRRSLVVTEKAVLARFPFQRVMDQLAAQSGVPGLDALALFRQWWNTQNPAPDGGCSGELNGYPYDCRPAATNQEGAEASADPFVDPGQNPGEYLPIGLFNRFDLAPASGANCGEHRIVYARRSGIPSVPLNTTRNLIIFEATLPNPLPQQGLKGCKNIVKFWADLTHEDDIQATRRPAGSVLLRGHRQHAPGGPHRPLRRQRHRRRADPHQPVHAVGPAGDARRCGACASSS